MSTVPPTPPVPAASGSSASPVPLTYPLPDVVRNAYLALYDTLQSTLENTPTDSALYQPLYDARRDVNSVLDKDTECRIHQNTAIFDNLKNQVHSTNQNLVVLTQQIAAIASHIAIAGDVVAAIGKLLSLLPPA